MGTVGTATFSIVSGLSWNVEKASLVFLWLGLKWARLHLGSKLIFLLLKKAIPRGAKPHTADQVTHTEREGVTGDDPRVTQWLIG